MEIQSKLKAPNVDQVSMTRLSRQWPLMSSFQLISAPSCRPNWVPPVLRPSELQLWSGVLGPPWNVPDVKPFSQTPLSVNDLHLLTSQGMSPPKPSYLPLCPHLPHHPQPGRLGLWALLGCRWWSSRLSGSPPDATDSTRGTCLYTSASTAPALERLPSRGGRPCRSTTNSREKRGLRELYDHGHPHAFFLVKFLDGACPAAGRKPHVPALLRSPMFEYW